MEQTLGSRCGICGKRLGEHIGLSHTFVTTEDLSPTQAIINEMQSLADGIECAVVVYHLTSGQIHWKLIAADAAKTIGLLETAKQGLLISLFKGVKE